MAKSIRSKWRRKCRAVKRERYGAKELAQLKKTLGIDENAPTDEEMKDISEIATITDAKTIKEEKKDKDKKVGMEEDTPELEPMDEDGKRIYNKKTMKDQFGNYPVWMNKRRIVKHKKGRGKSLKSTTKANKRLTRKDKIRRKKSNNQPVQQSNVTKEV
ncbi:hypothetical protein PV325_005887 [Microctonus aethiopoides]|uniref:Protein LLP homolog n=1 Tax=Microctonus aethiopoides TaxID=144406 RepID=A0AA39FYW2_9HYME|nr:hypothetical protein PV326_004411 [Microctonus aethiopoides]KAK0089740.1 hypothetical protein PV325_005887 [Microctonus aethiopoides]KAK0178410.1 hypothetical protein PV328_002360 [Microctonus aethiopoides]